MHLLSGPILRDSKFPTMSWDIKINAELMAKLSHFMDAFIYIDSSMYWRRTDSICTKWYGEIPWTYVDWIKMIYEYITI